MFIGWGPFSFAYWGQEARRVKNSFPYEANQGGIVFYDASNFRMWYDMTDDMAEYSNKEFNNISAEERSLYMADNIHPTKAGYLEWWTPYM